MYSVVAECENSLSKKRHEVNRCWSKFKLRNIRYGSREVLIKCLRISKVRSPMYALFVCDAPRPRTELGGGELTDATGTVDLAHNATCAAGALLCHLTLLPLNYIQNILSCFNASRSGAALMIRSSDNNR